MKYPRYWRVFLVLMIVVSLAFGGALVGLADEAPEKPDCDPEVTRYVALAADHPEYFPGGNTQRDALAEELPAPEECTLQEYKINKDQVDLETGLYTDSDFKVYVWNDGDTLTWKSMNYPVMTAFAKGGPNGGNLYMYYEDPFGNLLNPDGVMFDCGLNQPGGGWSHVTFYYCTEVETEAFGSLIVEKQVEGDVDGLETLPDFTITVTGPDGFDETVTLADGESATWTDLVAGDYLVTEDKTGLGDEWTVTGEGSYEVEEDLETTATIINTYEPELGSLTVTKQVEGDTSGLQELPDFVITVTGPDGFDETVTLADGESATWTDLMAGDYLVTEDRTGLSDEWVVDGEGTYAVENGEETPVTIINTFELELGSLTVTKEVLGDVDALETLPDFVITVTGPDGFDETVTLADGESATWTDLVAGDYLVTEDKTGLSDEWVVDGEGSYSVENGEETTATIVNTYDEIVVEAFGSLTVIKSVEGDTSGLQELPNFIIHVTGPEEFSETVTLEDGESHTWHELLPGMYQVNEDKTGLSTEWTVDGEGEVEVEADLESVVTIVNTYDEIVVEVFGSLTVSKEVRGDLSELDELPDFIIEVTGPEGFSTSVTLEDGESYTWHELAPGEYTVSEDKSELSDKWTVTGEGDVTVVEDQEASAEIVNSYNDLPVTGGQPALFAFAGLALSGIGVLLRRKW